MENNIVPKGLEPAPRFAGGDIPRLFLGPRLLFAGNDSAGVSQWVSVNPDPDRKIHWTWD